MKRLGISIYPERSGKDENKAYISRASQYGFTRIFTCLMSAEGDIGSVKENLSDIAGHAKSLGMEVIADVSPAVLNAFNVSCQELSFFHELGLTGIRLDTGFSGLEESIMTFNSYGLSIEINMSSGTRQLDNILSYSPKVENLIGCHNFYPHRYTGLSRKHFEKCSSQFKQNGIRTAAFISSKEAGFGPWPVSEGLCTLEEHRELPVEVQAKDLFNTGLVDDVIIANAFASDSELQSLGSLDKELLTLKVELVSGIPDIERKIVLEELHFNRGDVSEYMLRSTQSRIKYSGHCFKPFNTPPIRRGDILIDSSLYERYAGELQIALKDMDNSGRANVAGRVSEQEIYLLDHIRPWQKFKLIQT
ncbi:MAG TPA: MupG family TIM beta-alpha barrel fold protein [Clostridia bacterium]|nr:MupG family TIM beta-alpha barrel fold protein [Clostridia bacterium]